MSNSKEEMIRFVTSVADLLKEKCRMDMLHNNINFSRLMVYAQSVEESMFRRISRNLKSS